MGLFGNMFGGKTPEEKERERLAMQGGMLPLGVQHEYDAPQQEGLLGQQATKPQGYFDGGEFRARDGLSLLLASMADGMARNSGYEANASNDLFKGRISAMAEAKKRAAEQAKLQQMIEIGGQNNLAPQQVMAQHLGLNVPQAKDLYRFEDNAGNVWERGPDGENRRIFTDRAPKQNFIPDGMGGGRFANVPNPYLDEQDEPTSLGTSLPSGWNIDGQGGPGEQRPGTFPPRRRRY